MGAVYVHVSSGIRVSITVIASPTKDKQPASPAPNPTPTRDRMQGRWREVQERMPQVCLNSRGVLVVVHIVRVPHEEIMEPWAPHVLARDVARKGPEGLGVGV
jgi:hypothetical protein